VAAYVGARKHGVFSRFIIWYGMSVSMCKRQWNVIRSFGAKWCDGLMSKGESVHMSWRSYYGRRNRMSCISGGAIHSRYLRASPVIAASQKWYRRLIRCKRHGAHISVCASRTLRLARICLNRSSWFVDAGSTFRAAPRMLRWVATFLCMA